MNVSVVDVGGGVVCVWELRVYGDCGKGKRRRFAGGARREGGEVLYERFNEVLGEKGIGVERGGLGGMMDVRFRNWGGVSLMVE
ncbi:D-aminoacyl-tRNA deacylase, partial [Paenibacillus xylanexedens]|uniref:D-aminoacyl-tRNA deacylase n=1 Tax=Paenibacillus xylanexedens TaxID=528191 RepID=UPI0034D955F8